MSENDNIVDDANDLGLSIEPPVLPVSPFQSRIEEAHEIEVVAEPYLANIPEIENVQGDEATLIQYDNEGNQYVTSIDFSSPPLDADQARDITERIKSTTNLLFLLIKRAHAGKAYKALGYTSFEKYVKEEFNYSKGYAYRLINQADVIEAIEAKLPEGTEVYINEPVSQKLKKVLPELLEDIEERVPAGTSPEEAGQILDDLITEHKEHHANTFLENQEDEDEDDGYHGQGNGNYHDEDEDDVPDTSSLDELTNERDLVTSRFERSYNLYMAIQSMKSTRDAFISSETDIPELVEAYPQKRLPELYETLVEVLPWLTELGDTIASSGLLEELAETGGDNEEDSSEETDEQ